MTVTQKFLQALVNSPLFSPISTYDFELFSSWPTLADYNQHSNQLVKFVEQSPKDTSFEEHYEPRIFLKGEVQTRTENWHDFFNMLVWLNFPKSKSAINIRHYQAQKQRFGISKQRTTEEDALTLFDETGVVVVCDDKALIDLLREFKWIELFWNNREKLQQHMQFCIFGHGLYEKALNPYIGMTGQGLVIPKVCDDLDKNLAAYLVNPANMQSSKTLTPVPVLGIPGWWQDNESKPFYENAHYFREKSA